jgi:hypothetical protein
MWPLCPFSVCINVPFNTLHSSVSERGLAGGTNSTATEVFLPKNGVREKGDATIVVCE